MVRISLLVHTRDERIQIASCLAGLKDWAAEVIVCDMASADDTVEIARPLCDAILPVPYMAEFDAARNISADAATQPWILFLDADERLTDEVKLTIEQLVQLDDPDVAAYQLPFKTFSFGSWIQHAGNWWPSYKSPPLLRKGRFHFSGKVHDPAQIDGRVVKVQPRNDQDAIEHYSHRDLAHYMDKLNRYTSLEVEKLDTKGASWESAASRMGAAMRWYYDDTSGRADGLAGFLLSFGSGFYEAVTQLKAMERSVSESLPPSAEAFFAVAAQAAAQAGAPAREPKRIELFIGLCLQQAPGKVLAHVWDRPESMWLDWHTAAPTSTRQIVSVTHRRALQILGGGEVQLLESVRALYDRGVASSVGVGVVPSGDPLIHAYSLHLEELVPLLRQSGRPYVLTPIYWDRAELAWSAPRLIAAVETATTLDDVQSAYASLRSQAEAIRQGDGFRTRLSPLQQELVMGAAAILPNARCEAEMLQRSIDGPLPPVHVVPNAVALTDPPQAFEGLPEDPFVLCVGRIEPNKNQLSLLLAARLLNLPVVLIGSEPVPHYAALCRMVAGESARFLGSRPRDQVAYAMTRAAVHCLPSFAETPGLVNLEAAARGCPLVCSNRGAEREYFCGSAAYCDPLDLDSIAEAIREAMLTTRPPFTPATWSDVAGQLIAVYDQVEEDQAVRLEP